MNQNEGYVIIHPDGYYELDYFHSKFTHKYTGLEITPKEWIEMHRASGTIVKKMKLIDME